MGIRVHKQMGYGLTDIEYEGERITDPRINPESKFFSDYYDVKVEDYVAWLKERLKAKEEDPLHYLNTDAFVIRDLVESAGLRKPDFHDCFAYDPEFGKANVFVLTPLGMLGWRRYDDPIDYATETYDENRVPYPQANRADIFNRGLFPWSDSWMDAETGERLKGDDISLWIRSAWLEDEEKQETLRGILAKKMGYENRTVAEGRIVPYVPEEIRDLAEYGELFTDPKYVFQLRPMLYTLWH